MNWIFSAKQKQSLKQANARLNLWHGAVRSGKTVASIIRWLTYLVNGAPGDLLMVGKTERTLKRNILDPMEQIVGRRLFNYNRGMGELRIAKRRIYIAGANDERSEGKIRGLTLAGAYGDEITLWAESFFKILLSRLSVPGAKFFGTTNPDSPYHWLKTDYLDKPGLDLKQWHFTLEDNISLDPAYVASLKQEYSGLWYDRFILGLWKQAEGAVYDMWDDKIHTIDTSPADFDRLFVGIDYGTTNPTVFLLVAQDGGRLYVLDEYYYDSAKAGRQKTDAEYSRDLKRFIEGRVLQSIIIDPSAASFIAQLKKDGFSGIREADNAVLDGIRAVSTFLSEKRLFVLRNKCPNLCKEFTAYAWDTKAQAKGDDKPLKQADHCLDSLRYVVQTTHSRQTANAIGSKIIKTW